MMNPPPSHRGAKQLMGQDVCAWRSFLVGSVRLPCSMERPLRSDIPAFAAAFSCVWPYFLAFMHLCACPGFIHSPGICDSCHKCLQHTIYYRSPSLPLTGNLTCRLIIFVGFFLLFSFLRVLWHTVSFVDFSGPSFLSFLFYGL